MVDRRFAPTGVLTPGRPAIPPEWVQASQAPDLLPLAWELAQLPKALAPEARLRFQGLLTLLLEQQARGSTRLPLSGPALAPLAKAFRLPEEGWEELLAEPALAAFIGRPEDAAPRPLLRFDGSLGSDRMWRAERRLAASLRARLAAPAEAWAVDAAVLASPVALSAEQRQAVAAALSRPLTLVTGGPGTGKTSIVVALLRALARAGVAPSELRLAAPTGKAAQRMGQALRTTLLRIEAPDELDRRLLEATPEPRTLHRLLAWSPAERRFRHHGGRTLEGRILIVDEASMIGTELMAALLDALPAGTPLILLGDADQLPSVEAGSVFADLVAALPEAAARLTESYRMRAEDVGGRHILLTAAALLRGEGGALPEPSAGPSGVSLRACEGRELDAFLDDWLATRVQGHAPWERLVHTPYRLQEGAWAPGSVEAMTELQSHLDRARILTPLREGPRGAEGLNRKLHEAALHRSSGRLRQEQAFLLGEPVMVARNDYARGLFNGDQGFVLWVDRDGAGPRAEAVFPRGGAFMAVPLEAIGRELEHAYALTVHKAQGSEHDEIALVLPEAGHPLLTRPVLYTALTRARTRVQILGSREALEAGAARMEPRLNGLLEALAGGS